MSESHLTTIGVVRLDFNVFTAFYFNPYTAVITLE